MDIFRLDHRHTIYRTTYDGQIVYHFYIIEEKAAGKSKATKRTKKKIHFQIYLM